LLVKKLYDFLGKVLENLGPSPVIAVIISEPVVFSLIYCTEPIPLIWIQVRDLKLLCRDMFTPGCDKVTCGARAELNHKAPTILVELEHEQVSSVFMQSMKMWK